MSLGRITLQFESPVAGRIDSFKLYGAVLRAAYEMEREKGEALYSALQKDKVRMSTILPRLVTKDLDVQYFPVPKLFRILSLAFGEEDPERGKKAKKMKEIKYISEEQLKALLDSLESGSTEKIMEQFKNLLEKMEGKNETEKNAEPPQLLRAGFKRIDIPKNVMKRLPVMATPYYEKAATSLEIEMGARKILLSYSILIEYEKRKIFDIVCSAFQLLQDWGLGKRITEGFGKFRITQIEEKWDSKLFEKKEKYPFIMLLSNGVLGKNSKPWKDDGNLYTYSVCYGYNRVGERIRLTPFLHPGSILRADYSYEIVVHEDSKINYTLVGKPLTLPFPDWRDVAAELR